MMWKTVIKGVFFLMAILELSTSVPLNEGHFTYKDKVFHLPWNGSQQFCGVNANVSSKNICEYSVQIPVIPGIELAESCRGSCTLGQLKASFCIKNNESRAYIDIVVKIKTSIVTTTQMTTLQGPMLLADILYRPYIQSIWKDFMYEK